MAIPHSETHAIMVKLLKRDMSPIWPQLTKRSSRLFYLSRREWRRAHMFVEARRPGRTTRQFRQLYEGTFEPDLIIKEIVELLRDAKHSEVSRWRKEGLISPQQLKQARIILEHENVTARGS